MNTTTNTRGVSQAMVERGVAAYRKTTHSMPQTQHDRMRAALEATLSAPEPAAQGEEGFDVRKYVRHMADVLEAGGDLFKVDADLLRLAAAINKAANTAPPAQPAERVPDGWKLAMWVLQSDLYRKLPEEERAVCDALVAENPYITASPAPSDGGKEVERLNAAWDSSFKQAMLNGQSAQEQRARAERAEANLESANKAVDTYREMLVSIIKVVRERDDRELQAHIDATGITAHLSENGRG